MGHFSDNHEDRNNQHETSHKLGDETRHPLSSLTESQWKLKQQHDQNSQWKENHGRTNTSVRRNKEIHQIH